MAAVGCAVVETVARPAFLDAVAATRASIWRRACARCPPSLATARCAAGACCWRSSCKGQRRGEGRAQAALDRGLLINAPRPDSLRFMPALTVTRDEIDQMLALLESVLREA